MEKLLESCMQTIFEIFHQEGNEYDSNRWWADDSIKLMQEMMKSI